MKTARLLILLIGATCPALLAQNVSIHHDHVIPGYLFDIYENDVKIDKKVWLWVDSDKAQQSVTSNLIYVLVDHEKKAISFEAHDYSDSDGTIGRIEMDPNRLSFDLSLSWLVPGRTIRVACDGTNSRDRYNVTALGLWGIVGGTGTVKVEWKQTDEFVLPYTKVIVPFLELMKD